MDIGVRRGNQVGFLRDHVVESVDDYFFVLDFDARNLQWLDVSVIVSPCSKVRSLVVDRLPTMVPGLLICSGALTLSRLLSAP